MKVLSARCSLDSDHDNEQYAFGDCTTSNFPIYLSPLQKLIPKIGKEDSNQGSQIKGNDEQNSWSKYHF